MSVDVIGVHPYGVDLGIPDRTPPLGLLWIAAALERGGYAVAIYDEQVAAEDFDDFLAATRPRLALLSGTSHGRFRAFEYAAAIKRFDPSITVAYGGPHASFVAAETLARVPDVDLIGHGEGEDTCLELAAWKIPGGGRPGDLHKVKGITYRENGGPATTPPRERLADLDSLPLPARHLVPMGRYRLKMDLLDVPGTILMTSRGCPICCAFCSESFFFGKRYYTRGARSIVDEVEQLMTRYGVRGLVIFDSTFSLKRKHVEGFCDELERRRTDVPWQCQVRVDTVDKALLARMREAGCYTICFGVESGDQEVLDNISKGITPGRALDVMRWAEELGLYTKVSFSLGHPGETYEQAKKTNKFARRYARYMTFRGYNPGIRIYPGTGVEAYARERGLMPAGFDWAAPYENVENERLFKLKDNVPLLLQPQLGVHELRRLRFRFLLGYLLTPRYILTKAVRAVRVGEVGRLWRGLLRGLGFKVRREEDRVHDVPLGAAGDAAKR
jgi:anaerobic magnesium-protoporphyrin IX monomethyl ester cyclase